MKEENKAIIKALNMYGRVPETWELLEEIERLNNIINEAIEYIKKHGDYNKLSGCTEELDLYKIDELLDILKGSDKE